MLLKLSYLRLLDALSHNDTQNVRISDVRNKFPTVTRKNSPTLEKVSLEPCDMVLSYRYARGAVAAFNVFQVLLCK